MKIFEENNIHNPSKYNAYYMEYLKLVENFTKLDSKCHGDDVDDTQIFGKYKKLAAFLSCKDYHFDNVLELFSGIGYLTAVYNKFSDKVIANDKDRNVYETLKKNLPHDKISFYNTNAEQLWRYAIGKKMKFDVIDLDPYDNSYYFLPNVKLLAKDKFILFITTNESANITRKILTGGYVNQYYTKKELYKLSGINQKAYIDNLFSVIKNIIGINKLELYGLFYKRTGVRIICGVGYEEIKKYFIDFYRKIEK